MFKTPISLKGPAGQLQQHFTEEMVFKATEAVLAGQLNHWQYNDISQLIRAVYSDGAQTHHLSMNWPIELNEGGLVGKCSCAEQGHCQHLAALTIYSKSRLDLLPPFTQQVKALQDINNTFMSWITRQVHDPFPNMARHRVIYILSRSDEGQIKISIYKAYLSQDDRYQVKGDIDSSLYFKKQQPKFMSLADQYVFYQMNQNGLAKVQHFNLDGRRDESVLLMMLHTGRCFWKACYRPPITLHKVNEIPQQAKTELSPNLALIQHENAVAWLQKAQDKTVKVNESAEIQPVLNITTAVIDLPWSNQPQVVFDVAQPTFVAGDALFDLDDLIDGAVLIGAQQLEKISTACYQLEKLPSVKASFEPPISINFQVNDRYLGEDFTAMAPSLLALSEHGWQINIEADFRLNGNRIEKWFVDVQSNQSSSQESWFDLQLGIEVNQQKINLIPYLIKAIKNGAFDAVKSELMIQLDNGSHVGIAKEQVAQIVSTIEELFEVKQGDEKIKLNQNQLLAVVQKQQDWQGELAADNQTVDWMGFDEVKDKSSQLEGIQQLDPADLPNGLKATLRPYQHVGFSWLMFLAEHDFNGLLADDMGLGKTLQTLAFIQAQKEQAGDTQRKQPTSLIVAPTSLLGNWAAEASKFTPDLKVGIMTGPNRDAMYERFEDYDLIVVSYGIISRDFVDLNKKHIHLLVLDEAQAIKNRKTQVAQIIKKLTAKHRLCLSGTPVENHLGELWSIFDFLMPGFLGSEKQFQQHYQWPIEKQQDTEKLQQLQARLAPFILRRSKAEVAKELPEKNEIIKYIDLHDEQATVYESIRLTMSEEIRQAMKNQQNNQILIGNALLRLRQVCCHPRLIDLKSIDTDTSSAKLDWLRNALPSLVEEGRRILIFSSFTKMLDMIASTLDELAIDHYQLTGQTPPNKRTEMIADFQAENKPVFLISLKAGGAGINLTAADTVIHYDPWWNPAAEQQASDRVHRIGQDKQVFVYKLITRGTVEEKIYQLQQHKQQLADGLLTKTADISEILSAHQWQEMLGPIA
ncbi:DEAD/DEAH box helicase [Marinicella sp. S1101]|uniref:DEAD/DEAH box helicase n=1 Tax=Marinicella marina TaxID=2996016 RepID=UPI002260E9E9|nr:DEAD/DEAH box helicase [Marinicella marina]MCX7553484.1 DEAD/DEAH box helicase [Marinicella marina]MDJ1140108.1 DEAD/DEAH box helicase [Marinicella marina]